LNKKLLDWVKVNFNPTTRITINPFIPDFMVRRLFEVETGVAVTREEFAAAMDCADFIQKQKPNGDLVFNLSEPEYRAVFRRLA